MKETALPLITDAHFGTNIILTRDSLKDGQPLAETLKEIDFSGFRYPGGGVTEDQTWANGGLARMFGDPIEPGSNNYVMTINEALEYASLTGKPMTLVVPTFQFYDKQGGVFDHSGFDRYVDRLEAALKAFPDAVIRDLEIGNEYWGSKAWGSLTGHQYGAIADAQIPKLADMIERLSDDISGWHAPGLGVQAGVQWRATQGADGKWTADGPQDSADIVSKISLEHRGMIDAIFQHSYPDASTITQNLNWAIRPMEVFERFEGFSSNLRFSLSEFNIGANTAVGIDQGAAWIDAFSRAVDLGVDSIDHWGIAYDWLSNKLYDTRFPSAESNGGQIVTIATPMGQVYDIAQTHLVGKTTMTDAQALQDIAATDGIGVTGFADDSQKIVFLHNPTNGAGRVDIGSIADGMHVSVRTLMPADSPHSPWFDESARTVTGANGIADARADMNVVSGPGVQDRHDLKPGEMLVVVVSDPRRDLVIEGAHNVTDPATGMVDDLIVGGLGHDILRGHVGNDTIEGGGGRNVLSGGRGDDVLVASDQGEVIFADGGNDTVTGGDGDDMIVASGGDQRDYSVLEGGGGRNLFLVGNGGNASILDFSAQDHVGFGGAFADAGELRDASQMIDSDIVVGLPDRSQVILAGQAERIDMLHEQVLDFMDHDQIVEVTDSYLTGLTHNQVVEVFRQKEGDFDLPREQGASLYFNELEATMARLELREDEKGLPDDDPPSVPPVADDPHSPDPDDPYADQDNESASGGACFVATSAYGNPCHPDVVALRAFRDNHLIRTRAGRLFVRFYWIVGPKLAAKICHDHPHARATRYALSQFVTMLRSIKMTAGN
ncbi:calcium-binding protein [Paracoccus sp. PAMC 22219]|uniref:calcium-binding protein n=1 Tax=Paracoccus sp. PAMC 22219 TaxID=1569209 RepID=UPI000AF3D9C3|nr:calcium-binding protein [Paracoccus sp. PAMC 22219]